jgi:hypothetical protein
MKLEKIFKLKISKINPSKCFSSAFSFWRKNSNWIFIFSLLVFLTIGICIWYKNVYKFEWSEERKIEYINSRNKNINLQEEKFKAVLTEIEKRQINFNIGEKKSDLSSENQVGPSKNISGGASRNASVGGNTASIPAENKVNEESNPNDKNNAKFNPIRDIFK